MLVNIVHKHLFGEDKYYVAMNTWEKICAKVCELYSDDYESCYERCINGLEDCDDDEYCIARALSKYLGKMVEFWWTERGFRIEVCEEKEIPLDD